MAPRAHRDTHELLVLRIFPHFVGLTIVMALLIRGQNAYAIGTLPLREADFYKWAKTLREHGEWPQLDDQLKDVFEYTHNLENMPTSEDPTTNEDVFKNLLSPENSHIYEDRSVPEDPSMSKYSPIPEETSASEDTEDTAATEDPFESENSPTSEDSLAPEDTTANEDSPAPEDTAATEDPFESENSPTSEDSLAPEDIAANEDSPAPEDPFESENSPTSEDSPAPDDTATNEDSPASEDTGANVDSPAPEDTAANENSPAPEGTAANEGSPAPEDSPTFEYVSAPEPSCASEDCEDTALPPELESYNKILSDASEFEYFLDTADRNLLKRYDFSPMGLLTILATKAEITNTTSEQFIEEIQELVVSKSPARSQKRNFRFTNEVENGLEEDSLENVTELKITSLSAATNASRLKQLEEKYDITGDCCERDSVTYDRLVLMFPHFLNLGQKPLANSFVEISMDGIQPLSVPAFFTQPEFAGLIPTGTGREQLISIHLYSLYAGKDGAVPFSTRCKLVNMRMEKSLTSNARRIRYLLNNDLLEENGDVSYFLESLYSKVPEEANSRICRGIFGL